MVIMLEILGDPKPQKKTKFGNGRAYDPGKKYKDTIIWQISPYAPKQPLEGALKVDITFYMPIPKGTPKMKKKQMIAGTIYHTSRPDTDNLSYPVVNAMNDLFYFDDSQIVHLHAHKLYAEVPKIVVKLVQL